jgi:hypothetical protein
MTFLSLLGASKHVTLRVTSESGPAIFDAIVVLDRRRGFETRHFSGQQTPFETELPDADVTIMVRPRAPTHAVAAEYEVAVGEKRRLWVRSWHGTTLLRRHRGGVIGAGLPDPETPGMHGPPVNVLAI